MLIKSREGVDGTWSTFEIRVGTSAQVYRVLPATSWQETWVVYGLAASVCDASVGVAPNCQDARGGVFSNFSSTTWEQGKQYTLGVDTNLGESGEGQYGSSGTPRLRRGADIVQASIQSDWDIQMIQDQHSRTRLFLPSSLIHSGLECLDLGSSLRTSLDTVIRSQASRIPSTRMDLYRV